jgi:5'-deoxynucleotidase YfbR-like HD superfamily hydrolase
MATPQPATKKSVTIDPEVLQALLPERRQNLSATVNESLELLAALDAQQAVVDEWEEKHGRFTEDELRPFLEAAIEAQVKNVMRTLEPSSGATAHGRRRRISPAP